MGLLDSIPDSPEWAKKNNPQKGPATGARTGMFDHLPDLPQSSERPAPAAASKGAARRGMFDDLMPEGSKDSSGGDEWDELIKQHQAAGAQNPNRSGGDALDQFIQQHQRQQLPDDWENSPEAKQLAGELRTKADRMLLEKHGAGQGYAALSSFGNALGLNAPRNIVAGIRSLQTGQPFEKEYNYVKDIDEAAARQYPDTTKYAGAAGALGSALVMPTAPAASLAGRMAQGAAMGAGYGGLSEALGEHDLSKAALAAGTGAVLGGVAPPALEGLVGGVQAVGRAVPRVIRPLTNPDAEAARRVGAALDRDARVTGQPLDANALEALQGHGQPAVVADVGGKTTQSLARSAANTSTEARHALETVVSARFEGQAPRISQFVLGLSSGEDALATREALQTAARRANKPAYDRAYAQGEGGVWSDELSHLANAPDIVAAIKGAERKGANRAVSEGFKPVKNPFTVDEAGNVSLSDPNVRPNLQFWDAVKQNLDDRIGSLQRSGENSAARDAKMLRDQLVTHLDNAAPAYAEARAGAAKFFGAQDALEAGQKFVTATGKNSEYARIIAKMSEPEKKLFADGYASQLATKINETGDRRSVLNSIFNSPGSRERLRMALGPERAAQFEAFMRVESLMDRLRGTVSGNSTTARQLAEAGLAGGVAGGIFGGGDPRDVSAGALFGALAKRGKIKIDQRVAQRVGEMLASPDPEVLRKALNTISKNNSFMTFLRQLDAKVGGPAGSYAADRQERASGGRVDKRDYPAKKASRLDKQADATRKALGGALMPVMDLPDDVITRALRIARR